ncbi:hypothetical protein [Planktothricoides raciborskii]|uniref:Uncharacterized protein n=1 Tax=Planktothricoides raciborskii FACHB-1370 TaxID=2949576 RepID=A0ABR8EC03_9CYAN|nr:hypothetical protein [Planktothricoides raciborskii]MBD2543674.1 hypothetical protein [Planktothricoides raciborskii FACHB-1370]MBD2582434.1 hypothetical protein [Planktothricoides raciborskii FACHB-1261]
MRQKPGFLKKPGFWSRKKPRFLEETGVFYERSPAQKPGFFRLSLSPNQSAHRNPVSCLLTTRARSPTS